MAANIKVVRLLTGEELLAEVLPSRVEEIKLRRPLQIVMMPPRNVGQQPSVGLKPWIDYTKDEEFTISSAHVVLTVTPVEEFINQYNTIFSGVITPTSKLILP